MLNVKRAVHIRVRKEAGEVRNKCFSIAFQRMFSTSRFRCGLCEHHIEVQVQFFFSPSGPGPPHYRGFTITLRLTTLRRTPFDQCSARGGDPYVTAHGTQKRQTSMRLGGIRTRNPSKGGAANPPLRPRDRWPSGSITTGKFFWKNLHVCTMHE